MEFGNNIRWAKSKLLVNNEKGFVLAVALVLMATLTLLGTAAYVVTSTDIKVGGNYKFTQKAFYGASAGIEHAREVLRGLNDSGSDKSTLSDELAARIGSNSTLDGYVSGTDDVPLVAAAMEDASYAVYLTNDPTEGATNQTDGNQNALFTSVGIGPDNARSVVEASINLKYQTLPPLPGGVNVLGESDSIFNGNAFFVDGKNYDLNGNLDSSSPDKYGVTVGDVVPPSSQTPQQALNEVNSSLSNQQKDNVQGKNFVAGNPATPSTGIDNVLSHSAVGDLVSFLEKIADNHLALKTGGDVTGPITGGTDANGNITMGSQTVNIGTVNSPKITILDGEAGGSVQADFRGNISGAGILVVKNNDLIFRGNVDWKGLVIVTGDRVGFGSFGGGGPQVGILGGLIVDETTTDSGNELVLQGNASIRYSQQALNIVQNMFKSSVSVFGWRQVY